MYPDISLVLTEKKITCMKLQTSSDPKDIPFIVSICPQTEGPSKTLKLMLTFFGTRWLLQKMVTWKFIGLGKNMAANRPRISGTKPKCF